MRDDYTGCLRNTYTNTHTQTHKWEAVYVFSCKRGGVQNIIYNIIGTRRGVMDGWMDGRNRQADR